MTEWEKMQNDMVYNDFDKDLFNRRVLAKNIFNKYNQTTDEDAGWRKALLTDLLGSIGENVYIEPTFKCEFGENIHIGNNVYINFGATFLDCSKITIGNDVLIGPNVSMYSANHSLDPEERAAGALIGGKITIEDKAWIAGDVKIMAGVTIGEGAVIGCGSIVTHDIPPRVLAAGNPCRVIREITEKDKVGYNVDFKEENSYEYVDLGLPSGLKWAKCNLGAETETDYGDYYMWGDVDPATNKECNWKNYKYGTNYAFLTKYNMDLNCGLVDGKTALEPEDDAVHKIMGGDWHIPTSKDFEELIANTTSEWVENYKDSGVNGRLFTSKANGNTLFIPASGAHYWSSFDGKGYYAWLWSSYLFSSVPSNAWALRFGSGACDVSGSCRCDALALRGVRK